MARPGRRARARRPARSPAPRWRRGPLGRRRPGAAAAQRGRRRDLGRRAGLEIAQDVVLGHAAGEAGARDRADVEVVLGGHLPDQRRRPRAEPLLGGLAAAVGRRRRRPAREPAARRGRGSWAAARRAARARPRCGRGAGCGAARCASGRRRRRRGGRGGRGGGGWEPARRRGATAAPASVSILATTVCTATVCPSGTRISASTPAPAPGSRRRPCRWRSRRSARRA